MPSLEDALFDALGFRWDRSRLPKIVPALSVDLACFKLHKSLSQFVWEATLLEGLSFTFSEVQTLLDGVTVAGHSIANQAQVLRLATCTKRLLAMVRGGQFKLTQSVFAELHRLVSERRSQVSRAFRDEQNQPNSTSNLAVEPRLAALTSSMLVGTEGMDRLFNEGVAALKTCSSFERAVGFYLFGSLHRFFDGENQLTSRFMMNGVLLSRGVEAISIPTADIERFTEIVRRFHQSKDGSEMMLFLAGLCAGRTSRDNAG